MQTKVFAVLALLLLGGISYQVVIRPLNSTPVQQRQEEQAENLINVFYQAKDEEEETLLDLIWLQKAARLVQENGKTHFNVVDQRTGISQSDQQDLAYIEGIIEITDDLSAQYNAEEIRRVNIEEL